MFRLRIGTVLPEFQVWKASSYCSLLRYGAIPLQKRPVCKHKAYGPQGGKCSGLTYRISVKIAQWICQHANTFLNTAPCFQRIRMLNRLDAQKGWKIRSLIAIGINNFRLSR